MRWRFVVATVLAVLPPRLHRRAGILLLGWEIDPTAYLGRSIIDARKVVMGPGAAIGSFNVIKGLDELRLADHAAIGFFNWISSPPSGSGALPSSPDRRPALLMGTHATILQRHFLDCSDTVRLGDYASMAGVRSTIVTHGINLANNRQRSAPVSIGDHTAVMTNCVVVGGMDIPARCVVSAGSVVSERLTTELTFYSGNPARAASALPARLAFFRRTGPAT